MTTTTKRVGLTKTLLMYANADKLAEKTHFTTEECKGLLTMYENLCGPGKLDRLRFRDFLHTTFDITDDVMLDLTFHGFDRNYDGFVDESEFIIGLSSMIRGDLDELIEFCYFIFDVNGDRSLAREELYQCLRGCITVSFGVDDDEIDDAERDIVEIVMKKLDVDKDGQITFPDFQDAVRNDPLLLQALGACLPSTKAMATFLALVAEDYRAYTAAWFDATITKISKSKLTLTIAEQAPATSPTSLKQAPPVKPVLGQSKLI